MTLVNTVDVLILAAAVGFLIRALSTPGVMYQEQDYCEVNFDQIDYLVYEGGTSVPYALSDDGKYGCKKLIYLDKMMKIRGFSDLQRTITMVREEGVVVRGYCGKQCDYLPTEKRLSARELSTISGRSKRARFVVPALLLIRPLYLLWKWFRLRTAVGMLLVCLSAVGRGQQELRAVQFPVYIVQAAADSAYTFAYDSTTRIYRTNLSKSDISLQYPEEVLVAMMNATGNDWVDFYAQRDNVERKYKKDRHYESLGQINGREFYFAPVLKLRCQHRGEEVTFIRYRIVDTRVPFDVAAVSAVVQENGTYRLKTTPTASDITFALTYLKRDVLLGLFDPSVDELDEFRERVSTNGRVDLSLVGAYFMRWYDRPDIYARELEEYTNRI